MPGKRPHARLRVSFILVASTFGWLTLAPSVFAGGIREEGAPLSPIAPAHPFEAEFVVFGPSLSPAVIGVMMAQRAAQLPLTPLAAPQRSPGTAGTAPSLVRPSPRRPHSLIPLFASYAVVQALDVHSTLTAVSRGAVEQNPLMAPLVNRPAAFVAFKAGVTAGAIVVANRLARHNRLAAYVLMFALNSAYAFVVVHNYTVASRAQ
jgi:hypothetical protein